MRVPALVHLVSLSVVFTASALGGPTFVPVLRPVLPGASVPALVPLAPTLTSVPGSRTFLAAPPALPTLPSPAIPVVAQPGRQAAAVPAVAPPSPSLPALQEAAARQEQGVAPAQVAAALFDGSVMPSAAAPADVPVADLLHDIRIADPAHAAALAAIVASARESATGRRTLKRVADLVRGQNRPLVFEFVPMRSAHAYVDWTTDVVRVSDALLKEDPRRAAPILIHELTHVLQKARGLPYHAFELELEAFLVTLRSAAELGVRYKRSDFQGMTQKRFAGGLDEFIAWLHENHDKKENFSLLSGGRKAFLAKLAERRVLGERAVEKTRRLLKRREDTLAAMLAASYPPEALASYYSAELEPARERARSAEGSLALIGSDIALLESPEGYARYRAFADATRAMARRLHAALNP